LSESELNAFAAKAFGFMKMSQNDIVRLELLNFLKHLPNSINFVTKNVIRSLFEEIGPNSENRLLSCFVAVVAKFLSISPDFVDELREKGFIDVVVRLLSQGELEDKIEAAKFMAVLSNGCFFGEERETFVRNRVIEELMNLIGSGVSDNDKLRITIGLLNVVSSVKKNGDECLYGQFCGEEFVGAANSIEWSDNETLQMHLSMLGASVRELLAS
jgi:hypothetical protein